MPEGLFIHRTTGGTCQTNSYLIADSDSKAALVIDSDGDPEVFISKVAENGFHVQAIVNTHYHADHIANNRVLKAAFDCPILIHELDAPYLTDSITNLSVMVGYPHDISPAADRVLNDGDVITMGRFSIRVIHTPGHTPGGICLLVDDILFAGDTLFSSSVGRTDFPLGNHEQLIHSIRTKLLDLPISTGVLPGHGAYTTIGDERESNPWL